MEEVKDLYNENYKWLKKKIEILGNGKQFCVNGSGELI